MRFDEQDRDWLHRPWIMAAIGAAGGLVIHLLTDRLYVDGAPILWRQAGTTFTAIAVLSFLLTVELRRWTWAAGFALGWGAIIALVGWFTASYNQHPTIFEFPFWSGILAVLVAAPLFQTIRDEGAWRFPYARLHRHAWTDAVIGVASIVFTGITFLLAWLIAMLFDTIGIEAIKELLEEEWFGWILAGFAFGAAVGMLRERDALLATLQRLVMIVLSVLAPVLAVALVLFIASLPFTGLSGLWKSDIPATPLLLLSGAGAILLANAVISDGREARSANWWLQIASLALVSCVLPLAILAGLSMGQRIGQYGWTPERIWGVVAVLVAVAYGLIGWWAIFRGRRDYDDQLRPLQTKLAIGLCGLALFLALPILDFGAISAQSQIARFKAGKVPAREFDWQAMAFDFGPAGRQRLEQIARSGPRDQRLLAAAALKSQSRYQVTEEVETTASAANLDRFLRVVPEGAVLSPGLRDAIASTPLCRNTPCALVMIDDRRAVLAGRNQGQNELRSQHLALNRDGKWSPTYRDPLPVSIPAPAAEKPGQATDLATAPVELRTVERRQLFVDGKPVGEPFE